MALQRLSMDVVALYQHQMELGELLVVYHPIFILMDMELIKHMVALIMMESLEVVLDMAQMLKIKQVLYMQ